MTASRYQFIASASLIALIFLCLGWELWWAPLKPGGSWLVLKSVFLLAPLFGILRGKRETYKWRSLFIQTSSRKITPRMPWMNALETPTISRPLFRAATVKAPSRPA